MRSAASLVLCSLAFWAITVQGDSETGLVRKHTVRMSVSASGLTEQFEEPQETEEPMAGSALQDVLKDVHDMVNSGETPGPDKIKVIQKIVTDELEPDLRNTREAAVKQIGINLEAINTCNANGVSTQQNIKSTTEVTVGQERTVHAACREEEKVKNSTKGSRCTELDDFLNAIAVPADLPTGKPRAPMVDYVKTMSGYFCPKGPTVTDLDNACKAAEKAHASHKDQCNLYQSKFELGFCTWRTQLIDTCDALSTCYDSSVKQHNTYVSATKELVKKWKLEFTALKKILCYVDVWLNDNNVQTADAEQYKKCNDATIDTSPMDVEYPKIPERATCDMTAVQTYPGGGGFANVEYSKFIDYINKVVACLKVPTPTVGPLNPLTTTGFPAPPITTNKPLITTKKPIQPTMGMSLAGNGCCRFDGWTGKNHGYQTEAACQKICADTKDCIAADTARPRGDKYDCYTFYGSGENFNMQCGKTNPHEKCFKKVVKEGVADHTDPNSAASQTSVGQMTFVGNGCCRFDGWTATNHGYTTETACQKICADKSDCVAADLARPRGDTYDCFTFYGTPTNFNLQCGTSNTDEKCFRNTKHIAAGYSK